MAIFWLTKNGPMVDSEENWRPFKNSSGKCFSLVSRLFSTSVQHCEKHYLQLFEGIGKMYPHYQIGNKPQALAASTISEYLGILEFMSSHSDISQISVRSKSRARSVSAAIRWGVNQINLCDGMPSPHEVVTVELLSRMGGNKAAIDFVNSLDTARLTKRVGRVKTLKGLPNDWSRKIWL